MHSTLSACAAIVAVAVTGLFAQTTPPAVAPSTGTTMNIGSMPVTWYGMAQFRFRDDFLSLPGLTDPNSNTDNATLSYQLGYKIGAKASPAKDVSLQFEIGNDWYGTDVVTGIPGNFLSPLPQQPYRSVATPFFDLAYAQWDPGYIHIATGIIPVGGNALMDLLGESILNNKSYENTAWIPWGVVTNYSQTGLRIGAPITTGPVNVGVNLMTAMFQMTPPFVYPTTTDLTTNHPAIEYLLELPITSGGFRANPQGFIIPDRCYNAATDEQDAEVGLGLDLGYKIDKDATLRGSFGYAQNSNSNSYRKGDLVEENPLTNPGTMVADAPFNNRGTNLNLGTTIMIGPGKLDFDFNMSTDIHKDADSLNGNYWFYDLKYAIFVSKNYSIMPRLRFFYEHPQADGKYVELTRPELIFTGTF
jgi:hypothetical protein